MSDNLKAIEIKKNFGVDKSLPEVLYIDLSKGPKHTERELFNRFGSYSYIPEYSSGINLEDTYNCEIWTISHGIRSLILSIEVKERCFEYITIVSTINRKEQRTNFLDLYTLSKTFMNKPINVSNAWIYKICDIIQFDNYTVSLYKSVDNTYSIRVYKNEHKTRINKN